MGYVKSLRPLDADIQMVNGILEPTHLRNTP